VSLWFVRYELEVPEESFGTEGEGSSSQPLGRSSLGRLYQPLIYFQARYTALFLAVAELALTFDHCQRDDTCR
jgi:hypothetical protein